MTTSLELLLDQYQPEVRERPDYATIRKFLTEHPNPYDRRSLPGHITGSAFLLSPDTHSVLLTHHKKLGIWLQLGGHSDGEADTLAVAHREAWEESGIAREDVILHQHGIFALKIDEIPAYGDMPAHLHYDIAFLFRARHDNYVVSEESHDLQWVALTEISSINTDPFVHFMAEKFLRSQNHLTLE